MQPEGSLPFSQQPVTCTYRKPDQSSLVSLWSFKRPFLTYYKTSIFVDFTLSTWNEYWFLALGILHGVQDKFPDDVSGAAVGPIFNGQELEL
jgi:hypothetical protein